MISEEKKNVVQNLTLTVGMLMLLVAAALPLLGHVHTWVLWLYGLGAVVVLAERMTERYHGQNLRISRLFRMAKVGALLYCASAFLVVYPLLSDQPAGWGERDWLAFLLAGAVMQIYATFMVEHEQRKDEKKNAQAPDDEEKKS